MCVKVVEMFKFCSMRPKKISEDQVLIRKCTLILMMEWNRIVPGLKEAAAHALNDYNWTPVRTLLEATVVKESVEYTQLQQIDVNDDIIKESCSRGFTELVSVFLNSGFPVNYIVNNVTSKRMLHLAAINGHLSLVKLLLNVGADIDCKMYDGRTPLFWTVQKGHLEVAKYLITAGADTDTCDKNGEVLLDAARDNTKEVTEKIYLYNTVKEEMLQLLLDSGCDPNKSFSCSPLYCAVRTNNVKYVKMLLEAGAHVNSMDTDDTPLHSAAWFGNISIMDLLLKFGADINAKNQHGDTALHRASGSGKLQSVKFLIEHGSQINFVNNSKQTPLLASFNARSFDVASLLINSGADIDLDVSHQTLHRAVSGTAPVELIEWLLERGACVTTVHHKKTALQHVISNRNYSNDMKIHLAKLLLIYGSDHYVQDYHGNALLHWACDVGDVELVKYLIYYGLNVDAKNLQGKKPYDIAKEKGFTNIVKAIIHYHCNKYTKF